jgi:hypothetical protein
MLDGGPVDLEDGSADDTLRELVAVCRKVDFQGRTGAPRHLPFLLRATAQGGPTAAVVELAYR